MSMCSSDVVITFEPAVTITELPMLNPEQLSIRNARSATGLCRVAVARRAKAKQILKGFLTSVPFNVYLLMIVVMLFSIHIPTFVPTLLQPMAEANSFCSVFMVGMLMDLPRTGKDVGSVLRVLGWRLPLGVLFAAACWFLLPFDASARKTAVMLSLAPTAVFSTLFTDRVLGNAKLAGFTLSVTAVISIVLMTIVNFVIPA